MTKGAANRSKPNRRRAAMVLMIGGYIQKAIAIVQGLVLIPMYLHFIGNRTYGLWLASGGVLVWLSMMEFGVGSLLIQRMSSAYGKGDYDAVGSYFVNGMLVYSTLFSLFLAGTLVISFWVPAWIGARGDEIPVLRICIQMAGVAASLEFVSQCFRSFAKSLQQPLFQKGTNIFFRLVGLAATIILLYRGLGLYSIAIGLLLATSPAFVFNGVHSLYLLRQMGGKKTLDKGILKDFIQFTPVLFLGNLGNTLVRNIEPTLIALSSGPEMAPAFVITRRAADLIGQLIQVINVSAFPGFSHFFASETREKSGHLIEQIMSIIFIFGIVSLSIYVAANKVFISLWVGPKMYLGWPMTLLMALGLWGTISKNFLSRFLVAMGDIQIPSLLNLGEALVRISAMLALLYWFGLNGLPAGMFLSCLVFNYLFHKRLEEKLVGVYSGRQKALRSALIIAVFMALASIAGFVAPLNDSWLSFLILLTILTLVFATLAYFVFDEFRTFLFSKWFRP